MTPTPSTPAARKFLLSKRSSQASHTPDTSAAPRFQTTPRFGAPPPSSFSAPKLTQGRWGRGVEDVDEEDDEEDGEETSPRGDAGGLVTQDSIEVESLAATPAGSRQHVLEQHASSVEAAEEALTQSGLLPPEARHVKRRKISVSPVPSPSSSTRSDEVIPDSNAAGAQTIAAYGNSDDPESESSTDTDGSLSNNEAKAEDQEDPRPRTQQPLFQAAPRFKPVEADPSSSVGLPAAFSPQRRGTKFLAGGMAAELQSWLSEVKGWEGVMDRRAASRPTSSDTAAPTSTATLSILIDEVRQGMRMYLVNGRAGPEEESKKLILAGEGRLSGLGKGANVGPGSVVVVAQPAWNITLNGVVWTVACDWAAE